MDDPSYMQSTISSRNKVVSKAILSDNRQITPGGVRCRGRRLANRYGMIGGHVTSGSINLTHTGLPCDYRGLQLKNEYAPSKANCSDKHLLDSIDEVDRRCSHRQNIDRPKPNTSVDTVRHKHGPTWHAPVNRDYQSTCVSIPSTDEMYKYNVQHNARHKYHNETSEYSEYCSTPALSKEHIYLMRHRDNLRGKVPINDAYDNALHRATLYNNQKDEPKRDRNRIFNEYSGTPTNAFDTKGTHYHTSIGPHGNGHLDIGNHRHCEKGFTNRELFDGRYQCSNDPPFINIRSTDDIQMNKDRQHKHPRSLFDSLMMDRVAQSRGPILRDINTVVPRYYPNEGGRQNVLYDDPYELRECNKHRNWHDNHSVWNKNNSYCTSSRRHVDTLKDIDHNCDNHVSSTGYGERFFVVDYGSYGSCDCHRRHGHYCSGSRRPEDVSKHIRCKPDNHSYSKICSETSFVVDYSGYKYRDQRSLYHDGDNLNIGSRDRTRRRRHKDLSKYIDYNHGNHDHWKLCDEESSISDIPVKTYGSRSYDRGTGSQQGNHRKRRTSDFYNNKLGGPPNIGDAISEVRPNTEFASGSKPKYVVGVYSKENSIPARDNHVRRYTTEKDKFTYLDPGQRHRKNRKKRDRIYRDATTTPSMDDTDVLYRHNHSDYDKELNQMSFPKNPNYEWKQRETEELLTNGHELKHGGICRPSPIEYRINEALEKSSPVYHGDLEESLQGPSHNIPDSNGEIIVNLSRNDSGMKEEGRGAHKVVNHTPSLNDSGENEHSPGDSFHNGLSRSNGTSANNNDNKGEYFKMPNSPSPKGSHEYDHMLEGELVRQDDTELTGGILLKDPYYERKRPHPITCATNTNEQIEKSSHIANEPIKEMRPESIIGSSNSVDDRGSLHAELRISDTDISVPLIQSQDNIPNTDPPQRHPKDDKKIDVMGTDATASDHTEDFHSSEGELGGQGDGVIPVPLRNPGMYCFFNSVVQLLYGCLEFTAAAMGAHTSLVPHDDYLFVTKFCQLICEMSNPSPLQENQLNDAVREVHKYFGESKDGDDVQKCFMVILTRINNLTMTTVGKRINKDCNASEAFNEHKSRNRGFVFDLFYGQMCHSMTCRKCKHTVNISFQLFKTLPLPITTSTGDINLRDCIDCFLQESNVVMDEKLDCGCEGGSVEFYTQCTITHSPIYLFIYLNRGSYFEGGVKNNTFVKCGERITLPTTEGQVLYRLISVIDHIGTNAGGHYYCKCNYESNHWWLISDEQVDDHGYNVDNVVTKQAIALMFKITT